jgi:hypothetical protein
MPRLAIYLHGTQQAEYHWLQTMGPESLKFQFLSTGDGIIYAWTLVYFIVIR